MARIKKTITIHAPVDKVFGYMADPTNLPEIWPAMIEVKNVTKSTGGAVSWYDWVYKMAGMRFEGTSQVVESVVNQRSVVKNEKGIPSTFKWTYEPAGDVTQVTVEVEYTIPVPLLGRLAEAFVLKQNEHEAEVVLQNLKAWAEA